MNPVPIMKLVELTKGAHTSQATFEAAKGLAGALDKVTVVSQDRPVRIEREGEIGVGEGEREGGRDVLFLFFFWFTRSFVAPPNDDRNEKRQQQQKNRASSSTACCCRASTRPSSA